MALLDVLDEQIFTAVADGEVRVGADGTARVQTAHLADETPWDTESATRFAIDCADHCLGDARDVVFADGSTCATMLVDARHVLDAVDPEAAERVGRLAMVSAHRRLARDRNDLAALSLGLASEDGVKGVEVFDDPAYTALATVTDAVLAAIEALRHHLLPHAYSALEDTREEHEAHGVLDANAPKTPGTPMVTPFGSFEAGGSRVLEFEPAWTSAREAARHARDAARLRGGPEGERAERTWQASKLSEILSRV